MSTASLSDSSKPRKWRRVLGLAAMIGLISVSVLAEIVLVEFWIATSDRTVMFNYSKKARHYELRIGGGHLIFVHVANWWIDTELEVLRWPSPPDLDVKSWRGFFPDGETRFAGCYFAAGEYMGPLMDVSRVVFSPQFQRGKGSRLTAFVIPIWMVCVPCALPSVWWSVRRIRRAKRNSSATELRPEVTPSSGPVSPG